MIDPLGKPCSLNIEDILAPAIYLLVISGYKRIKEIIRFNSIINEKEDVK